MMIRKCLKEWNATVEALGHGKQTILIRKYGTTIDKFLLYPTVSYALKDDYLDSFQKKHQSFVEENAFPQQKDNKILIKYVCIVEDIIEKSIRRIPPENSYIWTKNHVKSYITNKKAFIWILRVFKLKKPYWADPNIGAIVFANLNEEVSIDGMQPVIDDSEFLKILKELK